MNNKAEQEGVKGAAEGVCEVTVVNLARVTAACEDVYPERSVQAAADAFKVLSNPNRLRVLQALGRDELCVCDLRQVLGISMSGTSQVLRELRMLGAVEFRAEGKLSYYRLADPFWVDLASRVLFKVGGGDPLATPPQQKSS